jgi:hypothetical protein
MIDTLVAMAARYVRRKVEERPTREMAKYELLGLLSTTELESARKKRATIQPLVRLAEHSPLPVPRAETEEPFSIDTRELDVRVFRKHALGTAAPVVPAVQAEPAEESTEAVAPLAVGRGRVVVWTTLVSIAVASLALLFLALSK